MNEIKSEEALNIENNIFKVLPSQIYFTKSDSEKSSFEEKLSIKNLSNTEIILSISVSDPKRLKIEYDMIKLDKNQITTINIKISPSNSQSEDEIFVNIKALQFETKVFIKLENVCTFSTKPANNNELKHSADSEAITKLNKSSIAFLSNHNNNSNKSEKLVTEYSCKLLHSSNNLQNVKNEEKSLDFKKYGNLKLDLNDKAVIEDDDNKIISENESTERICDLIMQSKEEMENIVLKKRIISLKNEKNSLKERCVRLINKLNTVEDIIKEYQVIAYQNSAFRNLKHHFVSNFSLIGNSSIDKKSMSIKSIRGDNIIEELSNLTSRINDNNEISHSFLKQKFLNQIESSNINRIDEDTLKNVHNDFSNENKNQKRNVDTLNSNNYHLTKSLPGIYSNTVDYMKLNSLPLTRSIPILELGKPGFKRKIMTEEQQSMPIELNEIQNAIDFSIIPEIHNVNLITLKKFEDEAILKLKERFIELQYFSFIENKKRIDSLLQIQDNLLNMIVDLKEKYNKNIESLQDENNNQMKIILEDDYVSKCNYKDFSEKNYTMNILVKLEEMIKMFMAKASVFNTEEIPQENIYLQTQNQITSPEIFIEKGKVLDELWNDLQNMDLISNELYNFKVENKRLLLENKTLNSEVANLNLNIEELKNRITSNENDFCEIEKEMNSKDIIINDKENLISNLEKEIEEIKSNFIDPESHEEIINKYEEKIQIISHQLNQNQNYVQQLNDYCEDYKNSISNLYKKLSNKENEILELRSQLIIKDKIMLNVKKNLNSSKINEKTQYNKENDFINFSTPIKESKLLKEKDSLIEELKLIINKLQADFKKTQLNEKSLSTSLKLLTLENENIVKALKENYPNNYQNRFTDRRLLQKVENDIINKIFKYFSDLLIEIYVKLGYKIPSTSFNESESNITSNIENNSKILKDYINNIIAIFKSSNLELLDNSLKVNTGKILEFFQIILIAI